MKCYCLLANFYTVKIDIYGVPAVRKTNLIGWERTSSTWCHSCIYFMSVWCHFYTVFSSPCSLLFIFCRREPFALSVLIPCRFFCPPRTALLLLKAEKWPSWWRYWSMDWYGSISASCRLFCCFFMGCRNRCVWKWAEHITRDKYSDRYTVCWNKDKLHNGSPYASMTTMTKELNIFPIKFIYIL